LISVSGRGEETKTLLRVFSKDLFRYLPGQIGLALLAFFSVPLFTRILSPDQFGRYALVISTVAILLSLVEPLTMALVRFYPTAIGKELDVLLRTCIWAQVILVGSVVATGGFLAFMVRSVDVTYGRFVYVTLCILLFEGVANFLAQVLRARLQIGAFNTFNILIKCIGIGLGLALAVQFNLDEIGILWGIAVSFIVGLPFLWKMTLADVKMTGTVSLIRLREMIRYGSPLVIGNMAAWVLSQMDRYFIQLFYSAREVGIYSAAYSISENSIKLLATLFMLSSTPLLANVWEKQGQQAARDLLSSVTRLYLLVCIPAVAGLSVLAEPIMNVLTSSAFSSGYSIIPWVVAGGFFLGLQHRFNQVLRLLNRTGLIMLWVIVSGALNIALNWWLLPVFGYMIAAVNTLICYILLCFGQAWTANKYFHWAFPWSTALRSVLATGIMLGLLFYFIKTIDLQPLWRICLAVPLGIIIYGLGVWVLGEVSSDERKAMALGVRRRFAERLRS
jgi:O-antigen/teichoic acid export membrane protein